MFFKTNSIPVSHFQISRRAITIATVLVVSLGLAALYVAVLNLLGSYFGEHESRSNSSSSQPKGIDRSRREVLQPVLSPINNGTDVKVGMNSGVVVGEAQISLSPVVGLDHAAMSAYSGPGGNLTLITDAGFRLMGQGPRTLGIRPEYQQFENFSVQTFGSLGNYSTLVRSINGSETVFSGLFRAGVATDSGVTMFYVVPKSEYPDGGRLFCRNWTIDGLGPATEISEHQISPYHKISVLPLSDGKVVMAVPFGERSQISIGVLEVDMEGRATQPIFPVALNGTLQTFHPSLTRLGNGSLVLGYTGQFPLDTERYGNDALFNTIVVGENQLSFLNTTVLNAVRDRHEGGPIFIPIPDRNGTESPVFLALYYRGDNGGVASIQARIAVLNSEGGFDFGPDTTLQGPRHLPVVGSELLSILPSGDCELPLVAFTGREGQVGRIDISYPLPEHCEPLTTTTQHPTITESADSASGGLSVAAIAGISVGVVAGVVVVTACACAACRQRRLAPVPNRTLIFNQSNPAFDPSRDSFSVDAQALLRSPTSTRDWDEATYDIGPNLNLTVWDSALYAIHYVPSPVYEQPVVATYEAPLPGDVVRLMDFLAHQNITLSVTAQWAVARIVGDNSDQRVVLSQLLDAGVKAPVLRFLEKFNLIPEAHPHQYAYVAHPLSGPVYSVASEGEDLENAYASVSLPVAAAASLSHALLPSDDQYAQVVSQPVRRVLEFLRRHDAFLENPKELDEVLAGSLGGFVASGDIQGLRQEIERRGLAFREVVGGAVFFPLSTTNEIVSLLGFNNLQVCDIAALDRLLREDKRFFQAMDVVLGREVIDLRAVTTLLGQRRIETQAVRVVDFGEEETFVYERPPVSAGMQTLYDAPSDLGGHLPGTDA